MIMKLTRAIIFACSLLAGTACAVVTQPQSIDRPFTRIAFGSCAFQWEKQPVFRAVVASRPYVELSFGLVEIIWAETPQIVLSAIGVQGHRGFEYAVP